MASKEVDIEDIVPVTAYPIMLGIMLSVFTFSVDVFGGFDLAGQLFSYSSITVTFAGALALVSGVAIVATNEIDGSDYEQWEYGVLLSAFGFPVLHMLIPAVADLTASNDIAAFGVWLIASGAAVYVSYAE